MKHCFGSTPKITCIWIACIGMISCVINLILITFALPEDVYSEINFIGFKITLGLYCAIDFMSNSLLITGAKYFKRFLILIWLGRNVMHVVMWIVVLTALVVFWSETNPDVHSVFVFLAFINLYLNIGFSVFVHSFYRSIPTNYNAMNPSQGHVNSIYLHKHEVQFCADDTPPPTFAEAMMDKKVYVL